MTVSDSVEQTKQQDGAKDDGKKPVEVKDEDLVCVSLLIFIILFRTRFPFLL